MKTILFISLVLFTAYASGQNSEQKDYIPLPLPKWTEPAKFSNQDHYFIKYDIVSGSEDIVDTNRYTEASNHFSTESYIPEGLEVVDEDYGMKSFTDMEPVNYTTSFPASGNVKLFIKYPNSTSIYVGSGILLSKNIVLTAAHCIYDKDRGGWANYVKVVPGYKNGTEPFGHAYAQDVYTWKGWTEHTNLEWDMGIVFINKCLGLQAGSFGYGTYNDSFFTSNNFHNYSYPSSSPYNGSTMYYRHGVFDQVSQNILYFNNLSYGGQSGSGFYYIDVNGNRCTYAVLSHSTYSNQTGCTRITTPKYNYIWEVINEHQDCSSNGIEENSEEKTLTFQLFPNPAYDYINIILNEHHQKCTASIINLLGQTVMQKTTCAKDNKLMLPIEKLDDGLYFISLNDGKTISTKSFIKAPSQ